MTLPGRGYIELNDTPVGQPLGEVKLGKMNNLKKAAWENAEIKLIRVANYYKLFAKWEIGLEHQPRKL